MTKARSGVHHFGEPSGGTGKGTAVGKARIRVEKTDGKKKEAYRTAKAVPFQNVPNRRAERFILGVATILQRTNRAFAA